MGPMAEASEEIARIQQETAIEQLSWAREQDTMNREILNQVLDIQLPAMGASSEAAIKDRARYENLFQPLEENLVKEFQDYDTPARRDQEQGKAVADVSATFDAQRRNALSRLESYGVDPSQTRNAALDVNVRIEEAAQQAAAATRAGQRVEDVGRSLRAEAINIGRGMPSQVAQSYGTALQAGQGAVSGAGATTASSVQAQGLANQTFAGAQQGFNQSANIQNMGYQNEMNAWQAKSDQTMGLINAGAGIAGMMVADGGGIDKKQAIPFAQDGMVATGIGDGSGVDDAVPAQLSDGEFVIPADVVRKKGEEFFEKLIERYHMPAAEQRAGAG